MLGRIFGDKIGLKKPQVPESSRIYAIGDIHGRADLVERMHTLILEDAKEAEEKATRESADEEEMEVFEIDERTAEEEEEEKEEGKGGAASLRKVAVYLGDYIDRGDSSREVIDFLLDYPLPGFESIFLMGNHEDSLLRFLDNTNIGVGWMHYGGDATLYSYGVYLQGSKRDQRVLDQAQAYLKLKLPPRHLRFYESLDIFHEEGDYFFVHAGVVPGVPLDQQNEEEMMWIRGEFLNHKKNFGKVIVHGHSITSEPDICPNRIGVDTGAYSSGVLTCLVLQGKERSFLQT